MSNGFFQRAGDVRAQRPIGFIGDFARSHDYRSITGINADPQAPQRVTIKVDSAVDKHIYEVFADDVKVAYENAGTDKAVTAAGLADAWNKTPGARRVGYAEADGVDTVTLTGVWPGVPFAVSTDDANLTVTTTAQAATADAIPFGRAIIATGAIDGEAAPKVALPKAANFTAQVMSFTITTGADGIFTPVVRIGGQTYTAAPVVHDTDEATTATAIATAINAVMPANTVLAGTDDDTVTLTAEVPGTEFDADIVPSGDAAATVEKTHTTGPSPATSLKRALVGISARRLDTEASVYGGPGEYAPNQGVEIATRGVGKVQRELTEAWSRGDGVWVGTGATDAGRLYNAAGTGRVYLGTSPIVIERGEHSTTRDGLGVVRIDMGA